MENPMQVYVYHALPGCSGCRVCERVCAIKHEGKINPEYSRIRVYQFYPGPLDVPIVCQYCEDKPCIAACPTGALTYNVETYMMNVDSELCTSCQECNKACIENERGGCITFNPRNGKAQVCDLCGGEAECAKHCPSNTLHFLMLSRFPKRLAKPPELIAERLTDNLYPVEKEVEKGRWQR
jgi:carbon-monoxide dehydrogenase iron sulfur subunit